MTPTAQTVRVRDTRDLLSVVPYALGYRPAECVVVLCVRPDGSLGLVARTALADLRRPADRAHLAGLVARRARQDATAAAYVVLYSAHDAGGYEAGGYEAGGYEAGRWDALPGTAHGSGGSGGGTGGAAALAAVHAFRDAMAAVVPDCETWHVGTERYRSLDCVDPGCCPPGGHPVEGLESTTPGAQLVLDGLAPAVSREELYRVPRAAAGARDLAGRAAQRWERAAVRARGGAGAGARTPDGAMPADPVPAAAVPGDAVPGSASALHDWRRRSYGAWLDAVRAASRDAQVPVAVLGRLAAALDDTPVRDAVLLWCVPGCDDLASATAVGEDGTGARTSDALAAVVDPARARRPDEQRLQAAVTVLEAVVAHAAVRRTAPPLTLLAFLAWWSGEGGRAAHRVGEALEVDPEHRLAGLVDAALTAAVPPGWVRARAVAAS
ncbi:hypothetical protein DNL40_06690 [Xylanimonas oleitrophica]|uniref:DUF4192 family protein n=1 Tax=Xylanimonas oleitrophica TaxID=2607479 RepID=A0A2W5WT38_9MICO|nr:DUF4192 family protein [Xylanimonas oleitrophica]PZR53803.1 hypothetical protein DNL40_06690 [Xylanimonas oleitrophica]